MNTLGMIINYYKNMYYEKFYYYETNCDNFILLQYNATFPLQNATVGGTTKSQISIEMYENFWPYFSF